MPRLSVSQLTELRAYADASDRVGYYTYLEDHGFSYAGLALGVVEQDTVSGRFAVAFMTQRATELGITLTSDLIEAIGVDLMNADLDAREASGGEVLKYDVIWRYHTQTFEFHGLDADAWTANSLLQVSGELAFYAPSTARTITWTGLRDGGSFVQFVEAIDMLGAYPINAEAREWVGRVKQILSEKGDYILTGQEVDPLEKAAVELLKHIDGRIDAAIGQARFGNYCFPADTTILVSTTKTERIADLRVGDTVLAFDAAAEMGRGALVEKRVVRLYRNTTTEWLKLSWMENGEPRELVVTPGHRFLTETGAFEKIGDMLENGRARIVLASGVVVEATAEKIVYSQETAGLFERARTYGVSSGNAALAPVEQDAWQSYNFEVEDLHTYVAEGVRVHNDSQVYIDTAGAIGQAFGTQLGQMLTEGESQFVQLAAGTALGVVTRNLAEIIEDAGYHAFTGNQMNFGASLSQAVRQLDDIGVDFANAAIGTASSFLMAELGESLGLDGFGASLFNVSASAYTGSVLNQALSNIAAGRTILQGADFTNALSVLPGTVGTFFGSSLAQQVLPAETVAGTIGGSLGSVAGSALGSSFVGSVFGSATSVLGNFLLPGIGSFFGSIIGTFLGDLFADEPDPHAAIDLFMRTGLSADRGGLLEVVAQWKSVDGFPHDATTAWAEAVHNLSLEYVRTVGGFDYANAKVSGLEISQEAIDQFGLSPNELVRVLQQMNITVDGSDNLHYFVNGIEVGSAERMVDGAIAGFIKDAQVIGGDLLLQRAAANSAASDTATLSGDMAVAEQYAKYLNSRDAINALIVAQPDSVFAASWAITLAQANDLGLSRTNVTDFHGGLGGFLASLAHAGVSVTPDDVSIWRDNATGMAKIDIRVDADFQMPGIVDVFADTVQVVDENGGRVLRLGFWNAMSGVGYNDVTGQQWVNGVAEITGQTAGRDLWIAGDNANHRFVDSGTRYIGVGDAEIISSDDILVGGAGADQLDGAEGWDWIVGGGGNDVLNGGSEADTLLGGDGNDILNGGFDLDYLEGGAGADILNGGDYGLDWDTAGYAGSNAAVNINLSAHTAYGGHADGDQLNGILNLVGSDYDDHLTGNEYRNVLEGGAGADVLDGGWNTASDIYDFASYFRSSEGVTASLADRSVNTGDAAGDVYINIRALEGSAFGDILIGDANDNPLWGHGGDDVLIVGEGADLAYGGFGFDVMSYRTLNYGIVLNLQDWNSSSAVVVDDGALGVEAFEGTGFNDTLIGRNTSAEPSGASENDVLYGLAGNDALLGNAGSDLLDGGKGNDMLYGGANDDNLYGGFGNDHVFGEDGNDRIFVEAEDGADEIDGGGGSDHLYLSRAGYDVAFTFSLANPSVKQYLADGTTIVNIESLEYHGGNLVDTVEGGTGDDTIYGYGADDILKGASGNDGLYGGAGNDRLYGGSGNDWLDGGASANGGWNDLYGEDGDDTYNIASWTGNTYIDEQGHSGNDRVLFRDLELWAISVEWDAGYTHLEVSDGTGSMTHIHSPSAFESFAFERADRVFGGLLAGGPGASNDVFHGGGSDDLAYGGDGNDEIYGQAGDDLIVSDGGNDGLYGGAGNDRLYGGSGNDWLDGGSGDDVFVFEESFGQDRIGSFEYSRDHIDLSSVGAISDWNDLLDHHLYEVDGNAVIDDGAGNTITFDGLHKAALTDSDFIFA
ncbi:hypothetical protein JET14_22010 (plasmid) [Martelella lutilitoris]|uniref:Hint domain-containing protein n=1 Tax=Martelella lutilitoris TaxID=2583532 RepID=A0A7T7HPR9_9HYPH|nr:hypothetical protein [Martelella lutilitoris]QQM33128.1 hypothetical protein JET14_22010 [Martelella lutilitoris]QRX65279.1 hypothetical protein JS578_14695 [Dysgonomonadaceae bacterium zrk40]